jgi:hypothetical protein
LPENVIKAGNSVRIGITVYENEEARMYLKGYTTKEAFTNKTVRK